MKLLTIFLICFAGTASCQVFLDTVHSKSIQLSYENDLFTGTDRYYTQGIFLRYETTLKNSNHLAKRSVFRNANVFKVKNEISHQAYTPTTIKSDTLLDGNRPYAAQLVLTSTITAYQLEKYYSVYLGGFIGIQGPLAQGKELQTGIHKLTRNFLPLGWQYQLPNSLIIDIELGATKRFFGSSKLVHVDIGGNLRIGTLITKLNSQLNFELGYFKNTNKWVVYAKPCFSVIAYDGTLQGNLFSKRIDAAVSQSELNNFVTNCEYGFCFQWNQFSMGFHHNIQSSLFTGAKFHRWGGLDLAFRFR